MIPPATPPWDVRQLLILKGALSTGALQLQTLRATHLPALCGAGTDAAPRADGGSREVTHRDLGGAAKT